MSKLNLPPRVRDAHAFLRWHLFYPVAFSTLLSLGLLVVRMVMTENWDFKFLVWNLTLAWAPYWLAVWAIRSARDGQRRCLTLALVLWALFLPNAAYIMTDFVHVTWPRYDFPKQYDITLVFAFAWTGLLLWLVSVDLVRGLVVQWRGRATGWAFVLGSAGLTGAGIYAGRVLRWNSWHVVTRPTEILRTLVSGVMSPSEHTTALFMAGAFASVVMICYLTFRALRWDGGRREGR